MSMYTKDTGNKRGLHYSEHFSKEKQMKVGLLKAVITFLCTIIMLPGGQGEGTIKKGVSEALTTKDDSIRISSNCKLKSEASVLSPT